MSPNIHKSRRDSVHSPTLGRRFQRLWFAAILLSFLLGQVPNSLMPPL